MRLQALHGPYPHFASPARPYAGRRRWESERARLDAPVSLARFGNERMLRGVALNSSTMAGGIR